MRSQKAPKTNCKVEKASAQDVSEISALRNKELMELIPESFVCAREHDVRSMNETFARQVLNGLENDTVFLAKAVIKNHIVSVGAVSVIDFPPTPENHIGKAGYIHTMYTLPEHRRKGLAKQILDCLIEWCRQKGLKLILLAASDEGMKLYSLRGFQVWNTWMYLEPIGAGGDDETKKSKCK